MVVRRMPVAIDIIAIGVMAAINVIDVAAVTADTYAIIVITVISVFIYVVLHCAALWKPMCQRAWHLSHRISVNNAHEQDTTMVRNLLHSGPRVAGATLGAFVNDVRTVCVPRF